MLIILLSENACCISKYKFSDSACDISAVHKGAIIEQSLVVSIETQNR